MHYARLRPMSLAAALLATGGGCGDSPATSNSSTEATVTGTVTVKGKTATKGRITFDPSNIERKMEPARTTEIAKDGTYTIKTLVGENAVRVSTPEIDKDRQSGTQQQTFDVKPGENKFDVTVPPTTP